MDENIAGTHTQFVYTAGLVAKLNGVTISQIRLPLPAGAMYEYNGTGGSVRRVPDWLGSFRFGSNTSNTAQSQAYAPFGETYAKHNVIPAQFTGLYNDVTADLYDTPARELQNSQGRWISPDPAGLSAVDFTNPQTFNRYAYGTNNPLALTDPSGLDSISSSGFASCNDSKIRALCSPSQVPGNPLAQLGADNALFATWNEFTAIPTYTWVRDPTSTPVPNGNDATDGNAGFTITTENGHWQLSGLIVSSSPANNRPLTRPWVLSLIVPLTPVPGIMGVGPAGSIAYNPDTHTLCGSIGAGASVGKNVSFGPLLFGTSFTSTPWPSNADSILNGPSVSAGGNLPFPSPVAGLGYQVTANSSGVAHGPTAGVAGVSGSVTFAGCAKLF